MKRDAVEQMTYALRSLLRNLEGYPSYQSVDFLSERQQVFSQIAAVLSGDSGDKGFFAHFNLGRESCSSPDLLFSIFPFPLGRGLRGRVVANLSPLPYPLPTGEGDRKEVIGP